MNFDITEIIWILLRGEGLFIKFCKNSSESILLFSSSSYTIDFFFFLKMAPSTDKVPLFIVALFSS